LEIPLRKNLNIIQAKDKSIEERMRAIENISNYNLTDIESNIMAIISVIDPILSRAIAGDMEEKKLFRAIIKQLGVISEQSDKLPNQIIGIITDLLKKYHENTFDIETTLVLVESLRFPLRRTPWLFFKITPLLREIIEVHDVDEIHLAFLKLLSDVAWEIPYVVNDFEDILSELMLSGNSKIKHEAVQTIIKAGKKSFLAVKAFVNNIIEREHLVKDRLYLELLTSLRIPKDYEDTARTIYNLVRKEYIEDYKKDEVKALGVISLAQLLVREELRDLQELLLNDIIGILTDRSSSEILLQSAIQATMLPNWNKQIQLNTLYEELVNLFSYKEIGERTKELILESLFRITLQRDDLVEPFVKNLLEFLDFTTSTEIKKKIIDLLRSMYYIVKETDLVSDMATKMLEIVSNIMEKDYLRNSAGEILELIANTRPKIMETHSEKVLKIFQEIPDWITRDIVIKISGEILKKLDTPNDSFIQTLINGLFDESTYMISLDYLNIVAYKFSDSLMGYLNELRRMIDELARLEETILSEEGLEAYYHYVEEPKRLYVRILTTLALNTQSLDRVKEIIDILVEVLQKESNELIIKDIANSLREITLITESLEDYVKEIAKKYECVEKLNKYGFNI